MPFFYTVNQIKKDQKKSVCAHVNLCIIQQTEPNLKSTHKEQTHKPLNLCSQIFFPISFSKGDNGLATMLVAKDGGNTGMWTSLRWGNKGGYDRGLCLDEKMCVCVCVCVCEKEKEREEKEWGNGGDEKGEGERSVEAPVMRRESERSWERS